MRRDYTVNAVRTTTQQLPHYGFVIWPLRRKGSGERSGYRNRAKTRMRYLIRRYRDNPKAALPRLMRDIDDWYSIPFLQGEIK